MPFPEACGTAALGTNLAWMFFVFVFVFVFFCIFLAAPVAYGASQARVKSEMKPMAYVTAIAMPNLRRICDLHHSSQQRQILKPLSEARDQTHILMDTSRIHFYSATMGTPSCNFLKSFPGPLVQSLT